MRIFGIETEYGLFIEGRGVAQQIDDAASFVSCCRVPGFVGWDYSQESPRNDIRGFQVKSLAFDPIDATFDQGRTRTFDQDTRNDRVLINGARLYNDHGHPEYATPECDRILDILAHDLAGEKTILATAVAFSEKTGFRTSVYKNNTDFHGASYGTHENYSLPRLVEPDVLIRGLLPFLICRQILFGAGKVGNESGRPCKFQLSQRADFMHEVANIETLYRRPIFNTRDEPHADGERWQRVHVICGDANRMQWATAMKIGTTRLVLDVIENGNAPNWKFNDPVRTFEDISKDASLLWKISLQGDSWTTAPEVLHDYLSNCQKQFSGLSQETDWVLSEWQTALEDLSKDVNHLSDRCDWVAKLKMLEQFAEAEGEWVNETMQSIDLEYGNLNPDVSMFNALEQQGLVRQIIPETRVLDAITMPPPTRAAQRGESVRLRLDDIQSIGWRRVVFRDGTIQEFG